MSLIKCPECGNQVSTMAATCGQCGVKISGNIIHCSECGTNYLKDCNESCPYCGHMDETETQQPESAETTPSGLPEIPEEKHRKKSAVWRILFTLVFLALLGYGGYEGYSYYTNYTQRMEEKQRFEELARLTNPDFYRQYLNDYPESIYRAEVESRLQTLLDEDKAWEKTLQNCTKDSIIAFMNTYPGSLNVRKCQQLIDSIDWALAATTGTEEAVNGYLEEHPEGMYTNEAVEFKKKLDKQKATPEESEAISTVVTEFLTTTLPGMDKLQIENAIAAPMQSFCGTPKATAQTVVKFIKAKHTENVAAVKYTLSTPLAITREKLYDNTTGFRAECLLEEITTRKTGKRKTSEKQYTATCILNSAQKIVMIELKDVK